MRAVGPQVGDMSQSYVQYFLRVVLVAHHEDCSLLEPKMGPQSTPDNPPLLCPAHLHP